MPLLACAAFAGASNSTSASDACAAPPRGGGSLPLTMNTGGLVWNFSSGIEGWIPQVISLGNGGSQVFSEVGPFFDYTRFFSAFDDNPPAPVWQTLSPVTTFHHSIDSAETCDIQSALYDVYSDSTLTTRTVYVKRFSASTPQSNWSYIFPFVTNGHDSLGARISHDGTRIVAAVYDIWTNLARVAVFNSGSNVPISYFPVPTVGAFQAMALSGDGNTLYLASGAAIVLVDIPSGAIKHVEYLFDTIFTGHAVSGDGSMFAYGTTNRVKVFKRSPTTGVYSLLYTHTVPGQNFCDRVAISNDGSTLASAFEFSDHFLTVQIDTLDLGSGNLTMSHTVTGSGSYENVASAISIADNGQRFAVGFWGDQAGTVQQVQCFNRNQNAPIAAYALPGSVMAIDMSGDGNRVAVASKSTHANVSGQGGMLSLYQPGSADFALHGVPHAGDAVTFQLAGTPGAHARLLFAPAAAAHPTVFPGIGTLYIDRGSSQSISMGTVDANGVATVSYSSPYTPGATWYFQGFMTSPRALTHDWVQMTILP